jgi:DNA-directed RNA polymerase subunit alpha
VRLSGVNHEYATVPGVREDVLDILLNCKSVPVNSRSRDLEIGRLMVNGPATGHRLGSAVLLPRCR